MNDSLKTPGELATFVGNPDLSDSRRQAIRNDRLCEKLEAIIKDRLKCYARSYMKVWGFPFDPEELTQVFLLFFQRQLFNGKFTDCGGESFNAWVATVIQRRLNRIRRGLKRKEEDFQRYRETFENVSQRPTSIFVRDDFDCGPELREDMDFFLRWYDGTTRKGANHIPSILWLRLWLVLEKLFTTDSVTVRDWDVTRYVRGQNNETVLFLAWDVEDPPDLSDESLVISADSAWAPLTAALILAREGVVPKRSVWASAAYSHENNRLQAVVLGDDLAKLKTAAEFWSYTDNEQPTIFLPSQDYDIVQKWNSPRLIRNSLTFRAVRPPGKS